MKNERNSLPGPSCPGSQAVYDYAQTGHQPLDVEDHIAGCGWCSDRVRAIWRVHCPPPELVVADPRPSPLVRHLASCDHCAAATASGAPRTVTAPFVELALAAGTGRQYEARPEGVRVVVSAGADADPYRVVVFGELDENAAVAINGHQADLRPDGMGACLGELVLKERPRHVQIRWR